MFSALDVSNTMPPTADVAVRMSSARGTRSCTAVSCPSFTGFDLKDGRGGLPGQVAEQTFGQVPQLTAIKAVLGHGRDSNLYGKQTGLEAVEQFSGAPVK